MLEYDITDISDRIDINKTNESKLCDSHYWYFLDQRFKNEPYLCNCCHDFMQKDINFNDVAIVSVKGSDYNFWCMSKDDAINVLRNSLLNEKSALL